MTETQIEAQTVPGLEAKVRIFQQVQGKREVLGFAELSIAGCFVIKDICIIRVKTEEGTSEPFVSYPSKRGSGASEAKFFGVAHPITAEARARANETILAAYRQAAG